ncbi:MAG: hybrid sensor histidine kinase/response regulator, partial [Spirochaetales bacterium]|nr:hybrid sensor histidine kinase/response regulator [Spirochaetales bacterium]
PDIVLVDLKMPGMYGMEVLQKIREFDPLITPIVISGYGTIDTAVEALKKGADDFVCKPFDEETLTATVKAAAETRRRKQSAQTLENEKQIVIDNFAAVVCHQLKSPAAAASQLIDMIKAGLAGPLNDQQQDALSRAYRRLQELTGLVSDWLRLASVESGGAKLDIGPIETEQLIRDVWTAVAEDEESLSSELIVNAAEHCRPVRGDRHLLHQLFENILRNAIKYSPSGGHITVDIAGNDTVNEVSITDTGIGIPEEELPHLFTPFFRGARTEVKKKEGSGLGLVIARAIVLAHGGTITAKSKPGKGTTFTVSLPVFSQSEMNNENTQDNYVGRKE